MQAWYAEAFEREMGCTADELQRWLGGAVGGRPVVPESGGALVQIGDGRMRLAWRALPPRQIAQIRMPRLAVTFRFEQVEEVLRQQVMRYFDLYTQRGGG